MIVVFGEGEAEVEGAGEGVGFGDGPEFEGDVAFEVVGVKEVVLKNGVLCDAEVGGGGGGDGDVSGSGGVVDGVGEVDVDGVEEPEGGGDFLWGEVEEVFIA